MKADTLQDLFIDELQDIYSAENLIVEALPKMIEKASSPDLKQGFKLHLEQTREQIVRLDRIFDQIPDVDREDKKCKGMEGIIKEGQEILKSDMDDDVKDAALIAAAQRVEHYEIASYGTVRTYANLLGRRDWAQLLEQTLAEEKDTDVKLSQLADHINVEAKAA